MLRFAILTNLSGIRILMTHFVHSRVEIRFLAQKSSVGESYEVQRISDKPRDHKTTKKLKKSG